MIKSAFRLSAFSFLFLIISCNSGPNKVQLAAKEVMAIHDSVMPKMGDIHRLKGQLSEQMESVDDSIQRAKIAQLYLDLEKADESMMQWMRAYEPPSANQNEDSTLNYLQEEKLKIAKVKEQMLQSIASAEKQLKNE